MSHSHDRTYLASLAFGDPDKKDPMHDLACEYLSQPMQADRLVKLFAHNATKRKLERGVLVAERTWRGSYADVDRKLDLDDLCLNIYPPNFELRRCEECVYEKQLRAQYEERLRGDYPPSEKYKPGHLHELVEVKLVEDRIVLASNVEVVISKGEGQYKTTIGFLDVQIGWRRHLVYESKFGRLDYGHLAEGSYDGSFDNRGSVVVEVKINPTGIGDIIRQFNLYREYVRLTDAWVLATTYPLDAGQVDTLKQSNIHPILLGEGFQKWHDERAKREPAKVDQF